MIQPEQSLQTFVQKIFHIYMLVDLIDGSAKQILEKMNTKQMIANILPLVLKNNNDTQFVSSVEEHFLDGKKLKRLVLRFVFILSKAPLNVIRQGLKETFRTTKSAVAAELYKHGIEGVVGRGGGKRLTQLITASDRIAFNLRYIDTETESRVMKTLDTGVSLGLITQDQLNRRLRYVEDSEINQRFKQVDHLMFIHPINALLVQASSDMLLVNLKKMYATEIRKHNSARSHTDTLFGEMLHTIQVVKSTPNQPRDSRLNMLLGNAALTLLTLHKIDPSILELDVKTAVSVGNIYMDSVHLDKEYAGLDFISEQIGKKQLAHLVDDVDALTHHTDTNALKGLDFSNLTIQRFLDVREHRLFQAITLAHNTPGY